MKRASLIASAVTAGVLWISAASASATTFCVPTYHPGCPNNGTNVEQNLIQAAVQSSGSDGIADTVLIGPQTVTAPGSIDATGSDPLTIRGSGPAQTVLTTSASTNIYLLNLFDRDTIVYDLTLEIPQSFPNDGAGSGSAVQMNGDALSNVDIRSLNEVAMNGLASGGLMVQGSGGFDSGDIYAGPGGAIGDAIRTGAGGGNLNVEDVTIDGARNAFVVQHALTAHARRVTILDPIQEAFSAEAGTLNIDNSIVRGGGLATPIHSYTFDSDSPTINADHVTGIYTGAGDVPAVAVNAFNGSGSPSLTLTNSIFRGYDTSYQRQTFGGATGAPNLTMKYSNVSGIPSELGLSGATTVANNSNQDPLFVNAAANDFHLTAGSPSIDAGDPAPGGLGIDFDLFARPEDGDGNGTAIRDQGAYEFRISGPPPDTTAPETTIDSGPGKKKLLRKRRATFSFSSNEPGSSFECKLDKGAFDACVSPRAYKRLKRGKHTFAVRAIDAAGNPDPSPATKQFKIKKKKRKR